MDVIGALEMMLLVSASLALFLVFTVGIGSLIAIAQGGPRDNVQERTEEYEEEVGCTYCGTAVSPGACPGCGTR